MTLADRLGTGPEESGRPEHRRTLTDDGDRLEITSGPVNQEPSSKEWAALLAEWGYDWDEWEVDEDAPMRVGGHEGFARNDDGDLEVVKLRNFRLFLRRRRSRDSAADIAELRKTILKRRPKKPAKAATTAGMVIALADWQIGKAEPATHGSAGTVDRIQAAFEAKVERIRAAKPETVALVGLGDLCENCVGFYPDQPNRIDLNRREQLQVASALLLWMVDQVVHVPRVLVSGVASNHGQNRQSKGAAATDVWRDNMDLELLDRLAQTLAVNPGRYGHVTVVGPNNRYPEVTNLEIDGAWMATHHGHFRGPSGKPVRGGTGRMTTALNWWSLNFFNRRGAADCDMLVFGHGHHLLLDESSMRPALQVPAMDPGSEHFSADTGVESPSGMVSFMFGRSLGDRVYSDLTID